MIVEKWRIRKASIEDVAYFKEALFNIYGLKLDDHNLLEFFKRKIKSQSCLIYVAENILSNIIGCIVCNKQDSFESLKSTIQIKEFYISPKYRKLNLADDLYYHIENLAIKMGVSKIEVMCNLTSTTTQNFYLRKKFKIDRKSYVRIL